MRLFSNEVFHVCESEACTLYRTKVLQLEYLKGIINYGLLYVRFSSMVEWYLDASLIINIEEHSSIKLLSNFAWGGAISWASKKQIYMKV